jgi:hypothetical protein
MLEAEVEKILGGAGEPVETSGQLAGAKTIRKKWVVGGKTIEVTLTNGQVAQKVVK